MLGIFGEVDHIISVDDVTEISQCSGESEEGLSYPDLPRRSARLVKRHDARALPQRAGQRRLESHDVILEKMLRERLGSRPNFVDF